MEISNLANLIESGSSGQANKPNTELGQQEFLQLLIAQMRHQDPINPMDGTEFASQLAQFNSVEQLIGVNEGIETLRNSQELMSSSLTNSMAASLTGQSVKALSDQVYLEPAQSASVSYKLQNSASQLDIIVRGADGNEIRRETMAGAPAGENQWIWDGYNNSGERMGEGNYTVEVVASNEGAAVESLVYTEGIVDKVRFTGQGVLLTVNGVEIPIGDVEEVRGKHLM
ncbi:MAG: flagellar hook capping FlgD N-terminal domain-containing protein [Balneolaceae bacterium]